MRYLQWDVRNSCMVEAKDAESIILPGYEEFQFFISRVIQRNELGRDDSLWVVSEATTGAGIEEGMVFGFSTKDMATDEALRVLGMYTKKQIATRIAKVQKMLPAEVKP